MKLLTEGVLSSTQKYVTCFFFHEVLSIGFFREVIMYLIFQCDNYIDALTMLSKRNSKGTFVLTIVMNDLGKGRDCMPFRTR